MSGNFTVSLEILSPIEGHSSLPNSPRNCTNSYHPQSDGQTESLNWELEQYVQLFTNEHQDNSDELLPLAEFSYNNHVHSATQHTPFVIDTGQHLCMGFELNFGPSQ
jgi:hypothetical protein